MDLLVSRKKVDALLGNLNATRKNYQDEKSHLEELKNHLKHAQEAQIIIQNVAQVIQQQAHSQIVGVVSRCLESVFVNEGYGFKIDFVRKRGRTEARLLLLKDENEIEDPLEADSGGVVDVAAFALRLSCLLLRKPKLRKVMILDEPFKFVSDKYIKNIRIMLKKLSKDFKIQFIMITHITKLKTGKVIRL